MRFLRTHSCVLHTKAAVLTTVFTAFSVFTSASLGTISSSASEADSAYLLDILAGYGSSAVSDQAQTTDEMSESDVESRLMSESQAADSSDSLNPVESELSASNDQTEEFETEDGEAAAAQEYLTSVLTAVEAALPSDNGEWAVYVCDLKTGVEGSINDHRMQAASLIKLYIMGAVYEQYEMLTEQYGKDSIDSNLYSMITVSDNDAANTLTTYLGAGDSSAGMQTVNRYCLLRNYTKSSMGRLLLQSNEFGDNYTSVANCGHFLKEVYLQSAQANLDSADANSEMRFASDMFNLLSAQTRLHKIPAQLPDSVSTASKTGELSDVENDAAILYDTDNDLILVFMSEHLSDCGAAQNTIASLSRQIYDAYCPQSNG